MPKAISSVFEFHIAKQDKGGSLRLLEKAPNITFIYILSYRFCTQCSYKTEVLKHSKINMSDLNSESEIISIGNSGNICKILRIYFHWLLATDRVTVHGYGKLGTNEQEYWTSGCEVKVGHKNRTLIKKLMLIVCLLMFFIHAFFYTCF